ncbi:hypothetical protein COLO4_10919 [Corchorus olitorius]|uniref:Uncharacterized protein n=1 Tax=Corchorus olitorius TaxID=93759 RepID=A0A1R3K6D6_9ROSI|nr:hypothetical protein COLO4_10919 [Corchorus olitorius]
MCAEISIVEEREGGRITCGTSIIPTVVPAIRSTWKYSRHLYARIQREQGRKVSIQSITVIRLIFDRHPENKELDQNEEEPPPEPPYDVVSGCWSGMILTGRFGMEDPEEAVEEETVKSAELGDA